jgi:hypothetical protein
LPTVLGLFNLGSVEGVFGEELSQNGADVELVIDFGNQTLRVEDDQLGTGSLLAAGHRDTILQWVGAVTFAPGNKGRDRDESSALKLRLDTARGELDEEFSAPQPEY